MEKFAGDCMIVVFLPSAQEAEGALPCPCHCVLPLLLLGMRLKTFAKALALTRLASSNVRFCCMIGHLLSSNFCAALCCCRL